MNEELKDIIEEMELIEAYTMWGESPEDLREWLGTIYEEIADSTPEAIDEYTIDRRWYGIEYEENGELYTVVIDEMK